MSIGWLSLKHHTVMSSGTTKSNTGEKERRETLPSAIILVWHLPDTVTWTEDLQKFKWELFKHPSGFWTKYFHLFTWTKSDFENSSLQMMNWRPLSSGNSLLWWGERKTHAMVWQTPLLKWHLGYVEEQLADGLKFFEQ